MFCLFQINFLAHYFQASTCICVQKNKKHEEWRGKVKAHWGSLSFLKVNEYFVVFSELYIYSSRHLSVLHIYLCKTISLGSCKTWGGRECWRKGRRSNLHRQFSPRSSHLQTKILPYPDQTILLVPLWKFERLTKQISHKDPPLSRPNYTFSVHNRHPIRERFTSK